MHLEMTAFTTQLVRDLRQIIVVAMLMFSLSACGASNEKAGVGMFYGTWGIDVERSMELARAEAGHSEKSDEELEMFFISRMSGMTIEIKKSEMLFHFAEESRTYGLTPVAAAPQAVMVELEWMGETGAVVLTRIGDDELHIKFSEPHDFDYCVWKMR